MHRKEDLLIIPSSDVSEEGINFESTMSHLCARIDPVPNYIDYGL